MKGVLRKKKWIAVLLCIAMLMSIAPFSSIVAFGEDNSDIDVVESVDVEDSSAENIGVADGSEETADSSEEEIIDEDVTQSEDGVMGEDDGSVIENEHQILISYEDMNGVEMAAPWSEVVTTGSAVQYSVENPSVEGYHVEPALSVVPEQGVNVTAEAVELDFFSVDADITVKVVYAEASVLSDEEKAFYEAILACENYEQYSELMVGTYPGLISSLYAHMSDTELAVLNKHLLVLEETKPEDIYVPAEPFTKAGPLLNIGRVISNLDDSKSMAVNIFPSTLVMQSLKAVSPATKNAPTPVEESGVQLEKSATRMEGASDKEIYKITLNAEATSKIVVTSIPCDIVLVLDRSESMTADKMTALKDAVNSFLETVQENSPASRVAMVSYADKNGSTVDSGNCTADNGAFVSIGNDEGNGVNSELTTIVNGLPASGSGDSFSDEGLEKATRILQSVPTDDANYENTRVVILFSDGIPGYEDYTYSDDNGIDSNDQTRWGGGVKRGATSFRVVAQNSIYWANIMKGEKGTSLILANQGFYEEYSDYQNNGGYFTNTRLSGNTGCGATVYCVGINLPSASTTNKRSIGSAVNEYFYRTSSDRKDGSHVGSQTEDSGWNKWNPQNDWESAVTDWNGDYQDAYTRNRGYYLYAETLDKLNDIFTDIANQTGEKIEDVTVRDYISQYFTICDKNGNPLSVGEVVQNGDYTGTICQDSSGEIYIRWDKVVLDPGDADPDTNDERKFAAEFYVTPKAGFLGGNAVPTNGEQSGLYDKDASEPFIRFPEPSVDVSLADIEITNLDKNVYLCATLQQNDLLAGSSVKVGGNTLNFDATVEDYGLTWQDDYANVSVAVDPTSLSNLTEDSNYSVTVTVSPAIAGSIKENTTETKTGKINVFKPELTYKDSEVYYGDNVPTDFIGNLAETKWFHKKVDNTIEYSDGVTMVVNQAPTLTIEYVVDITKIKDNKINTKQDVPVKVNTVKIGTQDVKNSTTFVHQACNPACGWKTPEQNNGNPAFLLHPKTCTLTITKQGGVAGEPYVFNVYKNSDTRKPYSQVTIVGNDEETIVELPVGTYTIQEDTGWSWRYNPAYSDGVILSKDHASGTLTSTNTKSENYWLNGYSNVVKNTYGQGN